MGGNLICNLNLNIILIKILIKSLWIKASAKCINVNVNVISLGLNIFLSGPFGYIIIHCFVAQILWEITSNLVLSTSLGSLERLRLVTISISYGYTFKRHIAISTKNANSPQTLFNVWNIGSNKSGRIVTLHPSNLLNAEQPNNWTHIQHQIMLC